jgi:tetratricopeptide (TPR) repeat protein
VIAAVLFFAAAISPTALRVAALRQEAAAKPEQHPVRLELARALIERHRETAGAELLPEAERLISRADPKSFERGKLEAALLVERGQPRAALDAAMALNRRAPDDLEVYGVMADAYRGLGNLAEAVKAVQWMLDLRPDEISGRLRAADLRDAYGDSNGASEMLADIYHRIGAADAPARAAVLTRLARLSLRAGKREEGLRMRDEALRLLPDYHPALELEGTR